MKRLGARQAAANAETAAGLARACADGGEWMKAAHWRESEARWHRVEAGIWRRRCVWCSCLAAGLIAGDALRWFGVW